jgi:hypothetical protein
MFTRNRIFREDRYCHHISALHALLVPLIDFRCENRKVVGELRGDIGAICKDLTPSFRKRLASPQRKPFSQEMHLKTPLLSEGLKLSNSKQLGDFQLFTSL